MHDYPRLTLTKRQLCDTELLLNGGFFPLSGFLSESDYLGVLNKMKLENGQVWPMPIVLDISDDFAKNIKEVDKIILQDKEGVAIALMDVECQWKPDKIHESKCIFNTIDEAHPGVDYLFNRTYPTYVGGSLTKISLPTHYNFTHLRLTPEETKEKFKQLGWEKIIAFQTRNPMHRAHQELTLRALKKHNANLLIHPVVGMTKPGDIDHYTRVRCYEKILDEYPKEITTLSLLPLAMRMAGPREALWHALIRKNYGCTHFIVGRDHAGPGNDSNGKPFYGPYDAQKLVQKYENEIAIKMIPFKEMVYLENKQKYVPYDEVAKEDKILKLSGTEFRHKLKNDLEIPSWFSFQTIIDELRKSYPPKSKQGFTVFFTGLPSAGKSTIANALLEKLLEFIARPITLLDGDIVRRNLSSELGFSKKHRNLNTERIGFVAAEITKHNGIAICAPIAPYVESRLKAKKLVSQYGKFIEVYVSTPLSLCEKRDRKGLYKLARSGIIKGFTGIDDPYEVPSEPDLDIDTSKLDISSAVHLILTYLNNLKLINVALNAQ